MKNWYKNSFPKVKDVISQIPNISKEIKAIEGTKNVYIWGSVCNNLKNANFPVRNLNVIVSTDFISDDFVSINEGKDSPLKIASNLLEENGYNPLTVNFTKNLIKIQSFNMDHWALSKDKKLLHWGPIFENLKEWKQVEKEIILKTEKEIGLKKEAIYKGETKLLNRWKDFYDDSLKQHFENMPIGWYISDINPKELKSKIKKI